MRRIILAAFVLTLATSFTVQAQTFTPEEQEIIGIVQQCWDSWAQEDYEGWAVGCPRRPEYTYWDASQAVPVRGWIGKLSRQSADAYFPIRDVIFYEVRPVMVSIFDDVAIYHHWATWTELDNNGIATTFSNKRIDVWQRVDGHWLFIGGMAARPDN